MSQHRIRFTLSAAAGGLLAAALIGLGNAPSAGAEGSAVDTAVDNFLQGIANDFPPEINEGSLGDPDTFCPIFFQCTDNDQMLDSFNQTVNTAFQAEGPIDGFFDQLLGDSAPAATLDMQVSINGTDLFPTAGNTATASSDSGDIAIAMGNGANGDATQGIGDFAFADGANSTADAGFHGNFDTAVVFGANSTAEAGFGSVIELPPPFQDVFTDVPNSFDLAAVFSDMASATATSGSFVTDIVP